MTGFHIPRLSTHSTAIHTESTTETYPFPSSHNCPQCTAHPPECPACLTLPTEPDCPDCTTPVPCPICDQDFDPTKGFCCSVCCGITILPDPSCCEVDDACCGAPVDSEDICCVVDSSCCVSQNPVQCSLCEIPTTTIQTPSSNGSGSLGQSVTSNRLSSSDFPIISSRNAATPDSVTMQEHDHHFYSLSSPQMRYTSFVPSNHVGFSDFQVPEQDEGTATSSDDDIRVGDRATNMQPVERSASFQDHDDHDDYAERGSARSGTEPPNAVRTTAPSTRHVCLWDSCGWLGSSFEQLTTHVSEQHVGKGKSLYVCMWNDCERKGRPFNQRQKVIRHVQTHTGDKPYECNVCQKRFSEIAIMQQHLRTHTGEKPFTCSQEGCQRSFSLMGALTIHMRTHTGEKPFQCKFEGCFRRFAESSNLTKHMRTHSRKKSN